MLSFTSKWEYFVSPGITNNLTTWLNDNGLHYGYDVVKVCRGMMFRRVVVDIPRNGELIIDRAISKEIDYLYKTIEDKE